MRTFEEIKDDFDRVIAVYDTESLSSLVEELTVLGTEEAVALSAFGDGIIHILSGDFSQAEEELGRAQALHEQLGDRATVARIIASIGILYNRMGEPQRTLKQYDQALAIYEEINDVPGIARVTGNIGGIYWHTGDYPRALELYERALALHIQVQAHGSVARITGNIGLVYWHTKDYQRALEQFERGLVLYREVGDRFGEAEALSNIAHVHDENGDHERSREYFEEALELRRDVGDRPGEVRVMSDLIETLLHLGMDDQAERLLVDVESMESFVPEVEAQILSSRAILMERRGELETAHKLLLEALEIVNERNLRQKTAIYNERLRDLARARNDLEGYVQYNSEYLRVTEEIRGKEATQRLATMEAQRGIEEERREREKERALLYGALPQSVADRKLRGEDVSADHFTAVSVIFLDIVGFTQLSDKIPPGHVVHLLEQIFSSLDAITERHGVTKIKTIGDSYMAVAGVPEPLDDHAQRAATCAVEMLAMLNDLQITMPPELGDTTWIDDVGEISVRMGLHCGPVTAGVIGTQRLQYDVWGDTVNMASRMESTGQAGKIQCSEAFAQQLLLLRPVANNEGTANSNGQQQIRERGTVDIKGKGTMTTYWLEGA